MRLEQCEIYESPEVISFRDSVTETQKPERPLLKRKSVFLSTAAEVLPQALPKPTAGCDLPGAVPYMRCARLGNRLWEG